MSDEKFFIRDWRARKIEWPREKRPVSHLMAFVLAGGVVMMLLSWLAFGNALGRMTHPAVAYAVWLLGLVACAVGVIESANAKRIRRLCWPQTWLVYPRFSESFKEMWCRQPQLSAKYFRGIGAVLFVVCLVGKFIQQEPEIHSEHFELNLDSDVWDIGTYSDQVLEFRSSAQWERTKRRLDRAREQDEADAKESAEDWRAVQNWFQDSPVAANVFGGGASCVLGLFIFLTMRRLYRARIRRLYLLPMHELREQNARLVGEKVELVTKAQERVVVGEEVALAIAWAIHEIDEAEHRRGDKRYGLVRRELARVLTVFMPNEKKRLEIRGRIYESFRPLEPVEEPSSDDSNPSGPKPTT